MKWRSFISFVTSASASERRAWAGYVLGRLLPRVGRPERIAFFLRANNHLYTTLGRGPLRFRYHDLTLPWERLVADVERFAPTIVVAPPRVLVRLAREAGIAPRQVVSVADVLHDDERDLLAAWAPRVDQVYQATRVTLFPDDVRRAVLLHADPAARSASRSLPGPSPSARSPTRSQDRRVVVVREAGTPTAA
jgi:hypothetical protein